MSFPQSLQAILPIKEDAMFIFQTREFNQQNPNSLTSIIFRLLFQDDIKGVLLVIYKTSDIDILCISDASFTKLAQFQSPQIRVIKVEKGGDIPKGLTDVIEKMKTLQMVSYADDVTSNLTQKLIDNLKSNAVTISKLSLPERFYHLQPSDFPQIKTAVAAAQTSFTAAIEALTKRAPKLIVDKIFAGYETIEKSNQFSIFTPQQTKLSITQTLQEGALAKGLAALRAGFSCASEMKESKFQAVQISCSSTLPFQVTLGRMAIVCPEALKKDVQIALDKLVELHELSIKAVLPDMTSDQLNAAFGKLRTASELKISEKLSISAVCGASQAGISLKSDMPNLHCPMSAKSGDSAFVTDANTPFLIRTTALIEVAGNAFYATFADTIMPMEAESVSQKSLTSPFHTRASVNEVLRDYYIIREVISEQPKTAPKPSKYPVNTPLKQKTLDDSDDSDSNSAQDVLAKRREAQARRRMLNERHEELRTLLKEDMQRRLQTQKLICDAENAQIIEIAYKEITDLPHALEFTKNSVVPGEKMFFFINGRPVCFLSSLLHSVTVSGDDKKQIRIKFIAPGQIVGKREMHPQLESYSEYSFLKEIVLETSNFSVVGKITDRFEKIRQNADKSRRSDATDIYQFAEFDVDYLTPNILRDFLTSLEPIKSTKSLFQIGSNTIGQTLEMRPKMKSANGGQGRKDQGDLSILENGIKYRYAAAGQAAVEIFFCFRGIRKIFYEKFRDNQHFCVVSILLYKGVRIEEIIVDQGMLKYIVQDPNMYERFTFICSMETQMQLGQGRDREEAEQENQTRQMMRRANSRFEEFFDKLNQQVNEYCQLITAEERAKNPTFINPIGMISQVSRRTKMLKFTGSVEMKGQQQVFSYDPNFLGVFNGKVQKTIDMSDIQIVVFENISYSTHNAFQIAFVYKDIRVEPYIIRQIQFHFVTDLQDYFTENKVYWAELNDSCVWAEMRKRFNASREEYEQFVIDGGWVYEFGLNSDNEGVEADEEDEDAYTASVDADPDDDEEAPSEYASESVKESDGSESVYDWSRSED
ncbi:FACT complex subunit spt16 [Spironucleus salmonicida]|uniref:FACT complex subunit n=1 Tax=Spironucleus salmonicida TaxID=348837 RepID=V6LCC3_9EUKA|nr:FACT complex subunit spt16 [Spironucleus salmonicida]|eukprot:EST41306.1 FACT complex subunit (SPT16/CDC68)-containing protein [Spironucleus salmonicida]